MLTEEPEYVPISVPETVEQIETRIWSDGYWLDATLYRPTELRDGDAASGVVMSHGWGGGKGSIAHYAVLFAERGIAALTFTHDGWFGSSGRAQILDDEVEVDEDGIAQVRIRVVRELIDPWNWVRNLRAATDFLATEPGVDAARLGAWGTSFGGGTALYCASTDDRFRAVVTQCAFLQGPTKEARAFARVRGGQIARGTISPFPSDVDSHPALRGTVNVARMQHYDPLAALDRLQAPALMMDAEKEELFDIRQSGGRAHELLAARGDIDVRYEVIPDVDHYGIYFGGFERGSGAALEWFDRHL